MERRAGDSFAALVGRGTDGAGAGAPCDVRDASSTPHAPSRSTTSETKESSMNRFGDASPSRRSTPRGLALASVAAAVLLGASPQAFAQFSAETQRHLKASVKNSGGEWEQIKTGLCEVSDDC